MGSTAQPFVSLMNNSCDTNTVSCTSGNYKIIAAARPIPKGCQVSTPTNKVQLFFASPGAEMAF